MKRKNNIEVPDYLWKALEEDGISPEEAFKIVDTRVDDNDGKIEPNMKTIHETMKKVKEKGRESNLHNSPLKKKDIELG